jgi:type IV pilus assembly protein PilW
MERSGMCPHTEDGVTLVELLIAMALSGLVLGAVVNTFMAQRRSYALQEQVTAMTQGTRAALEMVTRDVRMAGYNPAGTSFDGLTYDPTHVHIRADLNGDGDTADANETVIYAYHTATQQLMRDGDGSEQPIADHIQAFTFDYVDGAGTSTTTTAHIRQIRITITARTAKPDPRYAANGGYRTYSLTSLVTPTNLAVH